MQRVDHSFKDSQLHNNPTPSIILACSKCGKQIPKTTLQCQRCYTQHRSFGEE